MTSELMTVRACDWSVSGVEIRAGQMWNERELSDEQDSLKMAEWEWKMGGARTEH